MATPDEPDRTLQAMRVERALDINRRQVATEHVDSDGRHLTVPHITESAEVGLWFSAALGAAMYVAWTVGWRLPDPYHLTPWAVLVFAVVWSLTRIPATRDRRERAIEAAEMILRTCGDDPRALAVLTSADTVGELTALAHHMIGDGVVKRARRPDPLPPEGATQRTTDQEGRQG